MKIFITYGDESFQAAKDKIISEAIETGEFDKCLSFGRDDVTDELAASSVFQIPRGGGLWSWKPDVIWQTMQTSRDRDVIVYCDAGCTLQKSDEWQWYWQLLERYDMIAQRIPMRNDHYTRKEILDFFAESNGKGWVKNYQYQATIIIVVSDFTRKFVDEWRRLMLAHPEFAMDVSPEELGSQHTSLIENRHDQAVYSALVYKYLNNDEFRGRIYPCWERIEDCTLLRTQAIRATRLRKGQDEPMKLHIKRIFKRFLKHCLYIPFMIDPRRCWQNLKR